MPGWTRSGDRLAYIESTCAICHSRHSTDSESATCMLVPLRKQCAGQQARNIKSSRRTVWQKAMTIAGLKWEIRAVSEARFPSRILRRFVEAAGRNWVQTSSPPCWPCRICLRMGQAGKLSENGCSGIGKNVRVPAGSHADLLWTRRPWSFAARWSTALAPAFGGCRAARQSPGRSDQTTSAEFTGGNRP